MEVVEVVDALIAVHQEMQVDLAGDKGAVAPTTCPLTDLTGFDSTLIPTALRTLAHKMGHKLPQGTRFRNLYVAQNGREKLTIAQIAERFHQRFGQEASAA